MFYQNDPPQVPVFIKGESGNFEQITHSAQSFLGGSMPKAPTIIFYSQMTCAIIIEFKPSGM
jgi:hypothetical protein